MNVITVTDIKWPKCVFNRNQSCKALKMHVICLTVSDNNWILNEIKLRDNIEYERDMSVDNNKEYFN